MPGLVIDPEQNPNEEKQFGIIHIYGVLATYDKDIYPDMRYKPAGWLIDKTKVGIELRDNPYIWRDVVPVIYKVVAKSGAKIDKDFNDQGDLVKKSFDDIGREEGVKQKMKDAKIKTYKPHEK